MPFTQEDAEGVLGIKQEFRAAERDDARGRCFEVGSLGNIR